MTDDLEELDETPYIHELFGLEIDGPPQAWRILQTIGSVVGINPEGKMESWHFSSEDLPSWVALGLLGENLAIRNANANEAYFGPMEYVFEFGEDEEEEDDD